MGIAIGSASLQRRRSDSMMHLFVNSLAASAGGGLTYIRNVLPQLANRSGLHVTVALGASLREEFRDVTNVDFVELETPAARRFWFEQSELPSLIRRCGADVLLSTGNFALRKSPVPQILLSRNSIYTSTDYYRDLRSRHEYRLWAETHLRGMLARKSIGWADVTVAPSEAFAAELRDWAGGSARVETIHHGFDREVFTRDAAPLASDVEHKLQEIDGAVKLLFVSHYNYYRNFETLIRTLPLLRQKLTGRMVKLLLTCRLAAGENPGLYRAEPAAKLVKELGVSDMVVELGSIPYGQLHKLYARADVYATPAYTETFAHPLVEAMSCGLPVAASDLPVHREICREAALYFPRFSPEDLAARIVEIVSYDRLASRLGENGVARSADFSWRKHSDDLLTLARSLMLEKEPHSGRCPS
jgi:glycosyltransferase involved in cell wall biosynthesis